MSGLWSWEESKRFNCRFVRLATTLAILAFNHCWLRTSFAEEQLQFRHDAPLNSSKRSLNSYLVTSMPYIVDNRTIDSVARKPSEWHQLYANSNTQKFPVGLTHVIHSKDQDDACAKNEEGHCVKNGSFQQTNSAEATFQPYSQNELNKILQKYDNEKKLIDTDEPGKGAPTFYSAGNNGDHSTGESQPDKSKSWNLQGAQGYSKHPYDERMGWVTLEPIAWSSSQVQKWEPNQKPMWPPPNQLEGGHWNNGPPQQQLQPGYSWSTDRPWKRPTYNYQPSKPWNSGPSYGRPPSNSAPDLDIITDGQPGYFPQEKPSPSYKPWPEPPKSPSNYYYETGNRPQASPERPSQNSPDGDGHWVLLSSTKGYSIPHRPKSLARSLDTGDEEILEGEQRLEEAPKMESARKSGISKRTVRLTVLPPLPGTAKTVTSHGGMIEVESTKQTVDEAHREHLARMMRASANDTLQRRPLIVEESNRLLLPKAEQLQATKRNALLAAIGAGMIPATMAMLLPLVLGRRKRSMPTFNTPSLVRAVPESKIVTLNFQKFDTPGLVTRYTRSENPRRRGAFVKSYTIYE